MPATFQGSSFLITYPQTSIDKEELFTYYKTLPDISYLLLSKELHQDNGEHIHILAYFGRKQRFGARRLDYNDEHPNIETVGRTTRDWERVHTYCRKEDQSPLEWGTPRHSESIWKSIASSSSRQEAQRLLIEERPRDSIINARQFDYWLDKVCFYSFFPLRGL